MNDANRELPLFDHHPEPDPTASYHHGDSDSKAAHARIEPDAASMRRQILDWMTGTTATCDEIEEALGMRHQTASARMTELKRDGLIVPTGERRRTRSGCTAKVFRVASK